MIRNPLASLALIAALSSLPAAAQSARLFVFHGIPGLGTKVDVYANDGKLFTFDYGDIQGPLDVPPGSYKLEVKPEGQATVLLTETAGVVAGGNYSVIAHLKEDLNPTLSLFANDLSPLPAWKTRLAVRHTAGAGAVDLVLSRGSFPLARFKGLTNPNEILEELRAGRYQASLFAAGTRTRIAGPAQLTLLPGKFTQVFAVGELANQSFRLLVNAQDLTPTTATLKATISGQACGGAIGISTQAPEFGEKFDILLSGASKDAFGLMHIGQSDSRFLFFGLPFALDRIGAPGCNLYTSIEAIRVFSTDSSGQAAVSYSIPQAAARWFREVHFQMGFSAPQANSLGLLFTEKLSVIKN